MLRKDALRLFNQYMSDCNTGNLEGVKNYLRLPPHTVVSPGVAATTKDGITGLVVVATHGFLKILRVLLADRRVDPSMRTVKGKDALSCAVRFGHRKCVKLLLQHPRAVQITELGTVFHTAVENDQVKCFQELLLSPASAKLIDVPDNTGVTPLMLAESLGKPIFLNFVAQKNNPCREIVLFLRKKKVNCTVCQMQILWREKTRCSGCYINVRYCGDLCQKIDWLRGHRDICSFRR